jgi:glutathione peroxidase-family protein
VSGSLGSLVRWNFQKFLVDRNGVPKFRYEPNVSPETILHDIKDLL